MNRLSKKGWISIHRKIQDHWLWRDKPFSKGQAWIDILMMVNHEDNKILIDNELMEVKRGSCITSIRQLCEKWGWSNTKVRNFLNLLAKDNMLIVQSDTKKTILTVVNYSKYQDINDTKNDTHFLKTRDIEPKKTTDTLKNNDAKNDGEYIDNNSIAGEMNDRKNDGETTEKRHENDTKTTHEHTNNNNNNENNNTVCMYSEKLKEIVSLFEQNIGIIPPVLIDEINEYSNIFSVDMFREAIKIAANRKKRHVNYVLGVLRQWKDNNIITINDLEALRREKEQRAQEKDNKQYTKPKNRFHNFEQRTSKYTAEELEEIARRKREEYFKKIQEG